MKVLHICNNFLASAVHQDMTSSLRQRDIKNVVFAPVLSLEGRVTPSDGEYAVKCVNRFDRYAFYHKQAKIYRALQKTVPVESFDLVHTHSVFSDGNAALRLKRERKLPYLVTVSNTDLNAFFRLRRLLRKRGILILREAAYIVFISEAYRQALFQRYIPPRYRDELFEKTVVIPFGIDNFWFDHIWNGEKRLLPDNQLRLLYIGNVCENKNIEGILAAGRLLQTKGWDVSLTVAGEILSQKVFRKMRHADFVTYVGVQPKEALIEYYRQSDIFVMPSFTETFGLVYAEALSQGVPIIYSQGQGFDGQFPEGYVGYHADPHSAESVAAAIDRVAEAYDTIQKHCVSAAQKFSWEAIARQYQALYEQILS